jgi:GT2 family glycosyltransferase
MGHARFDPRDLVGAAAMGERVRAAVALDEAAPVGDVSVVVCTRDRRPQVERCLAALAALDPPPREVILVDNGADGSGTRDLVGRHPRTRYVRQPLPGLSRARNAGIRSATGAIIAFTDDDTIPRPDWAARIAEPFADPAVWAVTGLVLPTALATPAQVAFQTEMGGLNHGYRPMEFGPPFIDEGRWVGPPVWHVGAGANMAMRRSAFASVGLFDERLGAGAAGCSEDSEIWYRILVAGGRCHYHPRAVVLHEHRDSMDALADQASAYMRGHMAALFIQFSRHRNVGDLRRAALTLTAYHARRLLRSSRRTATTRAGLDGFLRGWRFAPQALRDHPAPRLDGKEGS